MVPPKNCVTHHLSTCLASWFKSASLGISNNLLQTFIYLHSIANFIHSSTHSFLSICNWNYGLHRAAGAWEVSRANLFISGKLEWVNHRKIATRSSHVMMWSISWHHPVILWGRIILVIIKFYCRQPHFPSCWYFSLQSPPFQFFLTRLVFLSLACIWNCLLGCLPSTTIIHQLIMV